MTGKELEKLTWGELLAKVAAYVTYVVNPSLAHEGARYRKQMQSKIVSDKEIPPGVLAELNKHKTAMNVIQELLQRLENMSTGTEYWSPEQDMTKLQGSYDGEVWFDLMAMKSPNGGWQVGQLAGMAYIRTVPQPPELQIQQCHGVSPEGPRCQLGAGHSGMCCVPNKRALNASNFDAPLIVMTTTSLSRVAHWLEMDVMIQAAQRKAFENGQMPSYEFGTMEEEKAKTKARMNTLLSVADAQDAADKEAAKHIPEATGGYFALGPGANELSKLVEPSPTVLNECPVCKFSHPMHQSWCPRRE